MTHADSNHSAFDLYRTMLLIRCAEEMLIEEYHPADEMRCPIHFCVGQEAAPAALGQCLQEGDSIFSHYRSHGYYLAKGAPLKEMVAEFYGKASGSNGGIAGSMELAHHDSRLYSGAIVGGSVGLAVGDAFAQKYRGSGSISIAIFGDGAMDEGVIYEAFNLAALHGLPVLFICENNLYAAHTALSKRMASPDLAGRAAAFGIEAEHCNDSDPAMLAETLSRVVSRVRGESRPVFLEIGTYRLSGHVGPEDDSAIGYRSADEVRQRQERDPLRKFRSDLIADGRSEEELDALHEEFTGLVNAAIADAKAAPFPDPSWAETVVERGSYDPKVTEFVSGSVGDFKGAQPDAKLAPY